jgi:enolase 1/2/3
LKIQRVRGRELLESRGNPTVEADVTLSDGSFASAMVPSGLSTGKREARELRDITQARWSGKGVLGAVSKINREIGHALRGTDAEVTEVDRLLLELDGTPDKSNLGANAILAVSLANARAIAVSKKIPLYKLIGDLSGRPTPSIPTPMVNIISGGLHADGGVEMQDFLVIPVGASSLRSALEWIGSVYQTTKKLLKEMGSPTLLADEGGFGPRMKGNEEALRLLQKSISTAELEPRKEVGLAIDVASSHFFRRGKYLMEGRAVGSSAMVDLYQRWISEYPIISLEDGCAEDDWEGWAELTSRLGAKVQLVGDDLFTTNPVTIETGKARGVANAVLIKPNQIGTLSETLESIRVCRKVGYAPVISARSGDTEDTFIADLAVGTSAGQIKAGSLARSERTAKYNQLLRLEERLNGVARYSGRSPFPFLSFGGRR